MQVTKPGMGLSWSTSSITWSWSGHHGSHSFDTSLGTHSKIHYDDACAYACTSLVPRLYRAEYSLETRLRLHVHHRSGSLRRRGSVFDFWIELIRNYVIIILWLCGLSGFSSVELQDKSSCDCYFLMSWGWFISSSRVMGLPKVKFDISSSWFNPLPNLLGKGLVQPPTEPPW